MYCVCVGGDADVKPLPEGCGLKEVAGYLREECKSEGSVKLGLNALLNLTAKQGTGHAQ